MFEFKIINKSPKSRARIGVIRTAHGEIETPCFTPVATQATIKALPTHILNATNTQAIISNTFHLHLKPGDKYVKKGGGLHKFMAWNKPILTDSGGYQVLSFGFGKDFGVGKLLKEETDQKVKLNDSPQKVKILDDGVLFKSPYDGKELFIGPKESMQIQKNLGADIIFAFDECTPPIADYEYTKNSMIKTHNWAKICLQKRSKPQALFGIVQGGKFKDLRLQSSQYISNLDFDGYGIGGEFGSNQKTMIEMLDVVISNLPENKPKHMLGIGYLNDIPKIISQGIDTFDCFLPSRLGRHGVLFGSQGKIDLKKLKYLNDKSPLDPKCKCQMCQNYSKNYLTHLIRANELSAKSILTFHNIYFFNEFINTLKEKIKQGKL